ncbi:MAG: energy transducer TonB [Nitrospirae bacterium]|nr:energy transducer TonB [Nitrospirota bacterium]
MEFRINVAFSVFIHALLITATLAAGIREAEYLLPDPYMIVTVLEDFSFRNQAPEGKSPGADSAYSTNRLSAGVRATTERLVDQSPLQGKMNEQIQPFPLKESPPHKSSSEKPKESAAEEGKGNIRIIQNAGTHSLQNRGVAGATSEATSEARSQYESQVHSEKDAAVDIRKIIRAAIEKTLIYPPVAKKRGIEGTAIMEFYINSRGYPEDIRIIQTSGSGILDAAAQETVLRASPFPVSVRSIEIPVTFRLKKN